MIRKTFKNTVCSILLFSMVFSSMTVNATAVTDQDNSNKEIETVDVQQPSYFVAMPKSIVLDSNKQAEYSIKVSGSIEDNQRIKVVPVDGIEETKGIDFYMEDKRAGSKKADVVATVTHNKYYWEPDEVADGYEENGNTIDAPKLGFGQWKGNFQMEIKLETERPHVHEYNENSNIGKPVSSLENTSNGTYKFVQDGSKWTSNNYGVKLSSATSTWKITVKKDTEYSIKYKVSSEAFDKLTIKLDDTTIANAISGAGSELTYTTTLTAGEHTLVATYSKDSSGNKNDDCGYLILNDVLEFYHKCSICGQEEEHHYGDDGQCIECGISKSNHEHSYTEEILKLPTCTEEGMKKHTCMCGEYFIEILPTTEHNYVEGICSDCGKIGADEKRIHVGDTESRTIAGQTLKFTCIDDAYVDASGEEKGALFVANNFISGNILSMATSNTQSEFVKDWSANHARAILNGETSDLSELVDVDTTIIHAYAGEKSSAAKDMGTMNTYGTAIDYSAEQTIDKVFILSLEEAVKYNKVNINGQEISVMWDMDCDGTIDSTTGSYRFGYYLRTPQSGATNMTYMISFNGNVKGIYGLSYGIRPCYVKNNLSIHGPYLEQIQEPTCTEDGMKLITCTHCGHEYQEVIEAKGHHYEEAVITKEPTCTEKGEKVYTCKDCGHKYKEPIEMIDHPYEEVIIKAPTCIEDGEVMKTCSVCGDSYKEAIPVSDDYHVYDENANVEKLIKWKNTSNGSYAFVQDGEKWTSNNKGVKSSTATSTWKITVEKDTEYTIKYKVSSEGNYDKLTIKLDNITIANAISGAGSELTYKNTLTAGEHTLTATYSKDSSGDKNNDCGYVILSDFICYAHKCSLCGKENEHHYGDDDKCTDCGTLNPEHKHDYSYMENITKQPTCTEEGTKQCTCRCGDSIEEVMATQHNYVNGVCSECGIVRGIEVGDTETRVIAGQTLEFICIDNAYVDASGEVKGALFIAKDFISGDILSMATSNTASEFVKDWSANPARTILNGETSDLSDLLEVDTTITKAYAKTQTNSARDMGTMDIYGAAVGYSAEQTIDKVFILSLEEAVKYNKVNINGQEISVLWDLDCDGTDDWNSSSDYGYYLRTPVSTSNSAYVIVYNGNVFCSYINYFGIRPCYVKS